jgi:hypothetical protein
MKSDRQDHEFVTAYARDNIRVPVTLFKGLCDIYQDLVTFAVTVRIVYMLEVVHVGIEEEGIAFLPVDHFEILCGECQKSAPVIKTGKVIRE